MSQPAPLAVSTVFALGFAGFGSPEQTLGRMVEDGGTPLADAASPQDESSGDAADSAVPTQ